VFDSLVEPKDFNYCIIGAVAYIILNCVGRKIFRGGHRKKQYRKIAPLSKGIGRKNSSEGGTEKKDRKLAKKTEKLKIAKLILFQGGRGNRKKDQKIAKKNIKK